MKMKEKGKIPTLTLEMKDGEIRAVLKTDEKEYEGSASFRYLMSIVREILEFLEYCHEERELKLLREIVELKKS